VSRRKSAVKRPVPPDPRYDSQTVSKFVNSLMYEGKKSLAEGIFYKAMDLIEERTGQPGVTVFKQAVNNVKPALEVKSRRVGGASLQVPVEVRPERRTALAMRWLIEFARSRTENHGSGAALALPDHVGCCHIAGVRHRAFAHYRW